MNDVKIYKCFIASPSDTKEERKICDVVFKEINKTLGERCGFRVESVKWENDATPTFALEGQQVINEQLFKDKDIKIFIGIMYHHFGTPTKNYGSGTEEEFYQAYEIHEKNQGSINIMLYFNDAPIKQSEISTKQSQKVTDFRELIPKLGGLYVIYNGISDFKEKLKHNLFDYFAKIYITSDQLKTKPIENIELERNQSIKQRLEDRLTNALSHYEGQPVIWIDRDLYKVKHSIDEHENKYQEEDKVETAELISKPYNLIIDAQPQFGLTCLAHHLVIKAFENGAVWVYLDAQKLCSRNIKITRPEIEKHIEKGSEVLDGTINTTCCIVLDSWNKSGKGMMKLLRNIHDIFQEKPIIVMSISSDAITSTQELAEMSFQNLEMKPLTTNKIRTLVSKYNAEINIDEDDIVLDKIIQNLSVLNIHRTPSNCLMLLKVSEKYFTDELINRAKVIQLVLTILFDFAKYPIYSSKPDVEHCEFVLGFFCEKLVRENKYYFSKDDFIGTANSFIKDNKIKLDVYAIFDTLFNNNIIISDESQFKFRHGFWIYYFVATRIDFDENFRDFMLSEQKYISFVEVIDFYTGINRKNNDLIELLTDELKSQCGWVERETGLDVEINPLENLQWDQSISSLQETHQHIKKEVLSSNLPDAVKDEYADKNYDFTKPDNQDVFEIYEKYGFFALFQQLKICSRALRNSDFIEPAKKVILLNQINRGWSLFSKLLFVLSPVLVKKDYAALGNFNVRLVEINQKKSDEKPKPEEKLKAILMSNVQNIVNWFHEDLFSERLLPIISEKFTSEKDFLIKHQLAIFLIKNKPNGWGSLMLEYIKSVPQKSFYLYDVYITLIHTHTYDSNDEQKAKVKTLIDIAYARKNTKSKFLIDTAKSLKHPHHAPKHRHKR